MLINKISAGEKSTNRPSIRSSSPTKVYFHENHDFYVPKRDFYIFSEKKQKIFPLGFFNPGLKTPKMTQF